MKDTPVLFLIFNRPDLTQLVFNSIRQHQPKFLYVAADGPREQKEGEKELCEQTRSIVTEGVDWECEVKYLIRDKNLGCGKAVSSAITWFFENVEEGIILEDDCLPDQSFFQFCSELLKRFRFDDSIFSISGSNFFQNSSMNSYFLSRYPYIWGWATWRRAWLFYDFEMKNLEDFLNSKRIEKIFRKKEIQEFWISMLIKSRNVDTWDFQWSFTLWQKNKFSVCAGKNLVENIGFGPEATHTKNRNELVEKRQIEFISDLEHPSKLVYTSEPDEYTFYNYYSPSLTKSSERNRIVDFVRKLISNK